jgi:glycosyltransferase involved in cell wall biosynthesis
MKKGSNFARPEISVLMPAYNAERYLKEAIESIIKQSFTDFELIVVDDGSTDQTGKILQELAGGDPRIHLFANQKNLGIVRTLNLGLVECKGKYIARMDADDISLPNRLQIQYDYLEAHPEVGALGSALSYIDGQSKELHVNRYSDLHKSLLLENPLFHPTVMFRNATIQVNQIHYREKFQWAEDYSFWLEIYQYSTLAALDEILVLYRITPEVSRKKHLKGMIKATISVKWYGFRKLKLTPRFIDILRFFLEIILLLFPVNIIWIIYNKKTRTS